MDKKSFKSKPYHLKQKHSGEIEKTIHTSDTEIGTSTLPANLHVYGTSRFEDPLLFAHTSIFGHRLSVSGSSSVPTDAVPSSSVLYLTPHTSEHVGLYNGDHWQVKQTSMVTKSLSVLSASNLNYDVFVYWNSSAKVVDLSFAPWSGNTTRENNLVRKDGVYVKHDDPTKRYAGTVRTVAAGVIADTLSQRFVWNFYNRVSRRFYATPASTFWNYSSATWRYASSGTTCVGTNIVGVVCGDVADANASVHDICLCTNDSHMEVGIGMDSTTNIAAGAGIVIANIYGSIMCRWDGQVPTGYHYLAWIEHGENATGTFYGYLANLRSCGLQGVIWG